MDEIENADKIENLDKIENVDNHIVSCPENENLEKHMVV